MGLEAVLDANQVKPVELARLLALDPSAVYHKLAGRRPWFQHEIDVVLAFLSERLGRPVTYEEAFAPHPALPAVVNE